MGGSGFKMKKVDIKGDHIELVIYDRVEYHEI